MPSKKKKRGRKEEEEIMADNFVRHRVKKKHGMYLDVDDDGDDDDDDDDYDDVGHI